MRTTACHSKTILEGGNRRAHVYIAYMYIFPPWDAHTRLAIKVYFSRVYILAQLYRGTALTQTGSGLSGRFIRSVSVGKVTPRNFVIYLLIFLKISSSTNARAVENSTYSSPKDQRHKIFTTDCRFLNRGMATDVRGVVLSGTDLAKLVYICIYIYANVVTF